MTNNKNNTCGIEKFEGDFSKEEYGVVILPIKTLNDIRNMDALGVYVYLLGRPSGWKLNVKQLQEHFQCGRDKIRSVLNYLLVEKFITCTHSKIKGQFTKPNYRVHLSRFSSSRNSVDFGIEQPETRVSTELSPEPENPATVFAAPVNTDTYISYNINNIEKDIKNPYVDSSKSTRELAQKVGALIDQEKAYKFDVLFMLFYNNYPNKQKPKVAYKAFLKLQPTEEFVNMLVSDIQARIENNWKGRDKSKIPFPATYLNGGEWEGEIYKNINAVSTKPKSKSWNEIMEILS